MTTTLNAVSGTGLVQTSDGSGIIQIQSNGVNTNAQAWISFGYVSSAMTIYKKYNVSSVTRSAAGLYTVSFTNSMPDTLYSVVASCSADAANHYPGSVAVFMNPSSQASAPTTSSFGINIINYNGTINIDPVYLNIAVFD